jgi:putative membrane protein
VIRELSLVVHVVGVVLWIGGAATAAWIGAQLALAPKEARAAGLGAARSAILALGTPGLLLAWLGGLVVLVLGWSDVYARAGWMHGKLTIALVLSALTGVLTARIRKAASGEREASSALLGGLAIALVVLAACAVALVLVRPGA